MDSVSSTNQKDSCVNQHPQKALPTCHVPAVKAVFFFSSFQWAVVGRFFSIFMSNQGLSESQIGTIYSISFLVYCSACFICSSLADKFQARYLMAQLITIMFGFVVILYLVPYYWLQLNSTTAIFVLYIFIHSLSFFLLGPQPGMIDALTLIKLKDDKVLYGQQRLFASISWGVSHILFGILTDYVCPLEDIIWFGPMCTIPYVYTLYLAFGDIGKSEKTKITIVKKRFFGRYQPITASEALDTEDTTDACTDIEMSARALALASKSDNRDNIPDKIDNNASQQHASSLTSAIKRICANRRALGIYFVTFSVGGALCNVESLLFVYLDDEFGDKEGFHWFYTLLGLAVGVSVLFEIPNFYSSKWLLNKIGWKIMLIVSVLLLIVRLISYTLITDSTVWCLLFIEMLHGPIFSWSQVSLIHSIDQLCTSEWRSLAMGSYNGMRFGMGPFCFVMVAGFIMQYYGAKVMYLVTSVWLVFALLLFVVFNWGIESTKEQDIPKK